MIKSNGQILSMIKKNQMNLKKAWKAGELLKKEKKKLIQI